MKKKFYISLSFIALATLTMLAPTIVPHHHHNGAVCMIMECCEQDNSVNDEHTGHAENDMDHGKSCIVESDFIIPQADNRIKYKVTSCDHPDHIHFFPVLYLVADFLLYPAETTSPQPEYGKYVSFYTSAEKSPFHGLRAPPCMLS
ncbi:MAG: hypothetical protein LBG96_09215 [Tannerella sp.]|nr:hypothetical protein [Tannerella sp.]